VRPKEELEVEKLKCYRLGENVGLKKLDEGISKSQI
jgi:hypothetical protein